jgi:predicted transcriptional regulator
MNKKIYKILNFTESEILIFESIENPKIISEITEETKIPRMTVHITLQRFIKRGLVLQNAETIENLKTKKKIKRNCFLQNGNLLSEFFSNSEKNSNNVKELKTKNQKVFEYVGVENIFKIFENLQNVKNEKWIIYQSNFSLTLGLQKIDNKKWQKVNNYIRENSHITVGFVEKDYIKTAKSILQNQAEFAKWKESLHRLAFMYEVSAEKFYNKKDIFVIRDSVYYIDWQKEKAVQVEDLENANTLRQLFESLKSSAKRVSVNEYLGE